MPRDALRTKGVFIKIPLELYELIQKDAKEKGALSVQEVLRPIIAKHYKERRRP